MAHFAEIDQNNIVTRVLVVDNSEENNGQVFLADTLGLGGTWIKTSYNTFGGVHANGGTPLRKNYAGIGYTYDEGRDAFIRPKNNCHDEEVLDEATCVWTCPDASHTIVEDF